MQKPSKPGWYWYRTTYTFGGRGKRWKPSRVEMDEYTNQLVVGLEYEMLPVAQTKDADWGPELIPPGEKTSAGPVTGFVWSSEIIPPQDSPQQSGDLICTSSYAVSEMETTDQNDHDPNDHQEDHIICAPDGS